MPQQAGPIAALVKTTRFLASRSLTKSPKRGVKAMPVPPPCQGRGIFAACCNIAGKSGTGRRPAQIPSAVAVDSEDAREVTGQSGFP
jgi:hypothetical protein